MKIKIYLSKDKKFVSIFAKDTTGYHGYLPIVFNGEESNCSILAFKLFFDNYDWSRIEEKLIKDGHATIRFGLTRVLSSREEEIDEAKDA